MGLIQACMAQDTSADTNECSHECCHSDTTQCVDKLLGGALVTCGREQSRRNHGCSWFSMGVIALAEIQLKRGAAYTEMRSALATALGEEGNKKMYALLCRSLQGG